MSRVIRRVPANWQHPTCRVERWHGMIETWRPLLADDCAAYTAEWDEQNAAWERGERPEHFTAAKLGAISYTEWAGERPDAHEFVPYDVNGDLPWFQMYETVSEGTPVTPAFATAAELIDFLVAKGQQYEGGETDGPWPRNRAEAFVNNEKWFPSGVMVGGRLRDVKDGFPAGMQP